MDTLSNTANTVFGIGPFLLSQIIATIAVVALYPIARRIRTRAIDRMAHRRQLSHQRAGMAHDVVGILSFIALIGIITLIWGIRIQNLAVLASAILASIAIGLFAQWSILSNVTASIIIFLRFPIRTGDRIGLVSDKSFSAIVTEFTPFSIVLKDDNGNTVVIPNSAIVQQQMLIIYDDSRSEQVREGDDSAR